MQRRQTNARKLSPVFYAALLFTSSAYVLTAPAYANTKGTLNFPSASTGAANDLAATILNQTGGLAQAALANRTVRLNPGDTLDDLLTREGVSDKEREAAIAAINDLYDPTRLSAGDQVELSMRAKGDNTSQLVALHIRTAKAQDLTIVVSKSGEFKPASLAALNWSVRVETRSGAVDSDIRSDLAEARIPARVAEDVIAAFAFDPDIPETISRGAHFSVVYESAVGGGAPQLDLMRFAQIRVNGVTHRVYRYETPEGKVAYMDEDGKGVMPLNLDAPVRYKEARMTSGFGWRVHPILKKKQFHKGVDFAAPRGTPVYAAEDGVVETAGWRGNYGRLVRLRHSDRVETAYAHLQGFARGIRDGAVVKKGQIIAYIGRSGLATGNHLYYEVIVDKKQVDPLAPKIMMQVNLDGRMLDQFRTYVAKVENAE